MTATTRKDREPPPPVSEQYALALEASAEGQWECDLLTEEMCMSGRAQSLHGLAPGATIRSRTAWEQAIRWHPDERGRRREQIEAFLAGSATGHEGEWRVMHPDGSYRWIRDRIVCARDPSGRAVRMAGCVTGIDAEKKTQARLRQCEERYTLADAAGDGHVDWIVDSDEFYGSPRLLELCGLPADGAFAGRSDFVSRFPHHPEDRDRVVQAMMAHYAGTAVRLEMDMRLLRQGETRWVHVVGVCTRDASGALKRWTSYLTDVTERKRAEAALRQSEERFALAVAASTDGIWDWDVVNDGMFLSEQAQRIYGVEPGPALRPRAEWDLLIRMPPEDADDLRRAIDDYLGDEKPTFEGEWRVRHGDGTLRWIRIRGLCVRDADGRASRLAGSVSDIDAQKRGEAARRRAQRLEAMGTLAGGIAHDFNNILGAVLGYGEMALRNVPPGSRQRRDLESIMSAGERGRALVERILTFSRSDMGEQVPVHVEKIVREALNLLAASLPDGTHIEMRLHAGRAATQSDPTQIHQLVMNLATNAIQAMPGGGTLSVSLKLLHVDQPPATMIGRIGAGEHLVLEVADTGTGIAPEIMDRIFDPFFTTKEVGVGTGLGLSLIHGIITEIAGAIEISSTVGAGSVFTVYLPRTGDVPSDRKDLTPVLPCGNGERILVVDDEEPLVTLTSETLDLLGYAPVGFTSSVAALDAFRAEPEKFDAFITDERMPGMSGSALIREVRGIRQAIPILLVSGNVSGALASQARLIGVSQVLKKPILAHELATALARALDMTGPRA